MDPSVSVVTTAASLKKNKNPKQQTNRKPPVVYFADVDVQIMFISKILCVFMETDFIYLLWGARIQ